MIKALIIESSLLEKFKDIEFQELLQIIMKLEEKLLIILLQERKNGYQLMKANKFIQKNQDKYKFRKYILNKVQRI